MVSLLAGRGAFQVGAQCDTRDTLIAGRCVDVVTKQQHLVSFLDRLVGLHVIHSPFSGWRHERIATGFVIETAAPAATTRESHEMAIDRILEPEVMDTVVEAESYNAMDHGEVNRRFVDDFLAAHSGIPAADLSPVLDLGTGTALIPIELCQHQSQIAVVATDLADSMLELAQENLDGAGLADRIRLVKGDAKRLPFEDAHFPTVISNSIVHHIPEPASVLTEAVRLAECTLYFRDLMRPSSELELQHLVGTYTGGESPHAQQLFGDSLRAALTLQEIRNLVQAMGFPAESVEATSDRHWTWHGRKRADD